MTKEITKEKAQFIKEYIDKIKNEVSMYEDNLEFGGNEDQLFDLLFETIKVFKDELPTLEDAAMFHSGTSTRDANTIIAIMTKYLIDNGYNENKKNISVIEKFWKSFNTYFENELPYTDYLKDEYLGQDNWNNGRYFVDIDYNYQYELHYGIEYNKDDFANINSIKEFIELSFAEWIKVDKRYEYTKEINKMFRKYQLPYKLNKGKIVGQGYKTSNYDEKIINYAMLERKIMFSEEMILSKETLDKKVALDYIVDSLQYLLSIQQGKSVKEKYKNASVLICDDENSKQYTVIKNELEEIMKIANEFFDIRHNEYFNASKEIREPMTDPIFIEYLYNRVYSVLYILKLKTKLII